MNTHPCRRFRFLFPFIALGFLALFTFAVYALWNGVATAVLGVKVISYWQALGLLVLAKILFGGFPGRGGFGPPWRKRMMARRWAAATPEERERMREEIRQRFGDWPRPPCDEDEPDTGKTSRPSGP